MAILSAAFGVQVPGTSVVITTGAKSENVWQAY